LEEIARAAFQALEKLRSQTLSQNTGPIVIPTRLVLRQSTAPPSDAPGLLSDSLDGKLQTLS
jgi:hypothetical protein